MLGDDGHILYPSALSDTITTGHMRLLDIWKVATATKELDF